MRKWLLAALLAPVAVLAQVEQARIDTKILCSPEFHGRGYVNGGDSIAAEYIAQRFEEIGCRTFKKQRFQPFTFNVNTFPGEMSLALNGRTLLPGIDYIVDPSSGGGTAQHQRVYQLPVAAIFDQQLLSTELRALIADRHPVTDEKTYPAILVYTTGLKGDSLKKALKLSAELTQEFTVLQITDAKFTWSVSEEQYKHPLIQVNQNAFDVSEPELFADFRIDAVLRSHTARNVIAYAPAKRRSKKYIVFSAHYDHLGRMGQATYFPGGNDNASGTAMLLALARYFIDNPADVNVVFMAFAGEEAGLIGSHYYVEHPIFPLQKIAFLTNVDIMGSGEDGITVVNATLFPQQFEALQAINTEKELLVKIGSRGPAANSDHYFFTEAGVPAFFFYTMGPNKHYHDVYDTYEELSFGEFSDIYTLLIDFARVLPKLK